MHFLIFTGGDIKNGYSTKRALKKFDKIVAVDGGASHCYKLQLTPHFLVGDFDSIDKKIFERFKKQKVKTIIFPKDKDVTDTELGIDTAIKNGATSITVFAGISGTRTDHLLSNVLLLAKDKYKKTPIEFVDGDQEIYLAKDKVEINGNRGDLISLMPIFGTVTKMKSSGLKYDLSKYTLSVQGNHGISNVLTKKTASVKFPNKTLLIVHTFSN